MFFKKKKLNENKQVREDIGTEKNPFGDCGYVMKEYYNPANLVVGQLARVSSYVTDCGPMHEVTQQHYLFEAYTEGEEIRYREIFTGFIAKDYQEYFDLPYVYHARPYSEIFPEHDFSKIPKLALLWELNDINEKVRSDSKKIKTYTFHKKEKS